MVLLEIVLQKVRGFSSPARVALKPGYWVLLPPSPAPAPLSQLLISLVYPEGRGEDAAFAAEKGAKAALTFQGRDQSVYRIVRELGRGGGLERYDAGTKTFQPITSDAQEQSQFLRGQAGLPARGAFLSLMCLGPGQLPSRFPKKATGDVKAAGAKPKLATIRPVEAVADVQSARVRLGELERELGLSAEIDELQFRLDGVATQLDGLKEVTRRADGIREQLHHAESEWAAAPSPESLSLPGDIVGRCERVPEILARRDEALAKLEADKQAEVESVPTYVMPLHQDRRFVAGLVLGTLFLVGGAMLSGMARYLALLEIPAFGFAALVALKHVESLQLASRVVRKGGRLAAREAKLKSDFEAELAPVQLAQEVLGVGSPREIIDILGRKNLLREQVDALTRRLEEIESDPEFVTAAQKLAALEADHNALTEQMREKAGGYVRDAREVEREIARLKEAIALAEAPPRVGDGSASADGQGTASGGQAAPGFEDFGPVLLGAAADLLATDIPTVVTQLKERCAQYVAALTDKRVVAIDADREGRLAVNVGGKRVPVGELPGKDLDLVFLALRFTLIERVAKTGRIPFIPEDGLPVDDAKLPLVGKMLKHLGTMAQVLQVTSRTAMGQVADGNAKL